MRDLSPDGFYRILLKGFPHEPTARQALALQQLSQFLLDPRKEALFLLKGFAGTGKTTIIAALVKHLWHTKLGAVLMAPTGRAAKVMSQYASTRAFTIHRKIYFPRKDKGGAIRFVLAPNKHRNTVFIVDEASMIPDSPSDAKLFENGALLDDLIQYVYSGHKCKLILIGDTAQLPPVKLQLSPALDAGKLSLNYQKEVQDLELDEVVRQSKASGILWNATLVREQIDAGHYEAFRFNLQGFQDIIRLTDGSGRKKRSLSLGPTNGPTAIMKTYANASSSWRVNLPQETT